MYCFKALSPFYEKMLVFHISQFKKFSIKLFRNSLYLMNELPVFAFQGNHYQPQTIFLQWFPATILNQFFCKWPGMWPTIGSQSRSSVCPATDNIHEVTGQVTVIKWTGATSTLFSRECFANRKATDTAPTLRYCAHAQPKPKRRHLFYF